MAENRDNATVFKADWIQKKCKDIIIAHPSSVTCKISLSTGYGLRPRRRTAHLILSFKYSISDMGSVIDSDKLRIRLLDEKSD